MQQPNIIQTPDPLLRPRVGIGVLVWKNGQLLLGKRKSSHGAGEYGLPGGHLEHMESIVACAKREVYEETGVKITNVRFLRVMNLVEYAPKHYIDVGMEADWLAGEPTIREPEKCDHWGWYSPDDLPSPLFKTLHTFLEAHRTGQNFFDTPSIL